MGLGTDISGGYSPSMYENIRQAVLVSRLLETGVDAQRPAGERGLGDARISLAEAFWLATAGGGQSLGLPVGTFEPGKAFLTRRLSTSSAATATSRALGSSTSQRAGWRGSCTSQRRATSARSTSKAA